MRTSGHAALGGADNDLLFGGALDTVGNFFLAGEFEGTGDFGLGPVMADGGRDIFLVKLSASGAVVGAKTFGSAGNERAYGIATDASGNVVLVGETNDGALDFGGGPVWYSGGIVDSFAVKLTSAGGHQWTKSFGGLGTDQAFAVAVGGSGSVVVAGRFTDSINPGGGPLVAPPGTFGTYVARFSSSGVFSWAKAFSATKEVVSYLRCGDVRRGSDRRWQVRRRRVNLRGLAPRFRKGLVPLSRAARRKWRMPLDPDRGLSDIRRTTRQYE